ncbi:MAG: DUF5362 family protein [Prevotellaceae bacterium]|jgi:hypothetical protein|nr:DUF5362 family protein [Prevotellaceae bacterium]
MEEKNTVEQPVPQEITLTEASKGYLVTAAKWSKFLAIVNFIAAGLLIVLSIVIALFRNALASGIYDGVTFTVLVIVYIGLGILCLFMAYYLFDFARETLAAIPAADASVLENAFLRMKSYWKFNGILTIVVVLMCIISIAVGITAGSLM